MSMCPHCGYNLEADKPLVSGEWTLTATTTLRGSTFLHLSPQESGVLFALARADGRVLSHRAIAERTGEAEDEKNLVRAVICKLRRKLPGLPIETVQCRGYRWIGERPQIAEAA